MTMLVEHHDVAAPVRIATNPRRLSQHAGRNQSRRETSPDTITSTGFVNDEHSACTATERGGTPSSVNLG